jgi:hypothetical protein
VPGKVPHPEELPESIRELSFRQAVHAHPDPDFNMGLFRLVEAIHQYTPSVRPPKLLKALAKGAGGEALSVYQLAAEQSQASRRKFLAAALVCGLAALGTALSLKMFGLAPTATPTNAQAEDVRKIWTEADVMRLEKEITSMRSRPPHARREDLPGSQHVPTLGNPDYSSFEILSDDRYWDLRGWRDLSAEPGAESSITLTRRMRVLKVASAREIRFQAKTDGEKLYMESLSHPAAYELISDENVFVGVRATTTRQLAIPVHEVPVGEEIAITTRCTYWGSMQDPEDRWLGAIGYPRADRLRTYVLMPEGRPYQSFELEETPSFRGEESRPYAGPRRLLESPDRMSLLWEIPTPQGEWVYTLIFKW